MCGLLGSYDIITFNWITQECHIILRLEEPFKHLYGVISQTWQMEVGSDSSGKTCMVGVMLTKVEKITQTYQIASSNQAHPDNTVHHNLFTNAKTHLRISIKSLQIQ
jgi:hypothetical protein